MSHSPDFCSAVPDGGDSARFRQKLRARMLERRRLLDTVSHRLLSDRINAHLLNFLDTSLIVAFYCPVHNEADIGQAMLTHFDRGGVVVLPAVEASDSPLRFRVWNPQTPLVPDRFGIPTPQNNHESRPDVLLLPLIAVDSVGFRLGYGGGFFDRTLAVMHADGHRPQVVGIGFEFCRVDTIRPQDHDIPLGYLVTETGVHRVAPA